MNNYLTILAACSSTKDYPMAHNTSIANFFLQSGGNCCSEGKYGKDVMSEESLNKLLDYISLPFLEFPKTICRWSLHIQILTNFEKCYSIYPESTLEKITLLFHRHILSIMKVGFDSNMTIYEHAEPSRVGFTPLGFATKELRPALMGALINSGASLTYGQIYKDGDVTKYYPLFFLLKDPNLSNSETKQNIVDRCVKILKNNNCNLNEECEHDQLTEGYPYLEKVTRITPMVHAAHNGNYCVLRSLVYAKAEMDWKVKEEHNCGASNVLHLAAKTIGNWVHASHLIYLGADFQAKDKEGRTAYEVALQKNPDDTYRAEKFKENGYILAVSESIKRQLPVVLVNITLEYLNFPVLKIKSRRL